MTFSLYNAFWLSDSLRNLGSLRVDYTSNLAISLEVRDYRSPSPVYGDDYRLNLFKVHALYSNKYFSMSMGDNDITFGRGLSVFLSHDERAVLESFLRGGRIDVWALSLYSGFKRKWVYYTADSVGNFLAGGWLDFGNLGLNALYYTSDTTTYTSHTSSRRGYMTAAFLDLPIGTSQFYLEASFRSGYDPEVLSENAGGGVYANLYTSRGRMAYNLEFKYYRKLYAGFNLPTPANGYGLLPTNARNEVGFSMSSSYNRLTLEVSQTRQANNPQEVVMNFAKVNFYTPLNWLTLKLNTHVLFWAGNFTEKLAYSEIKTNTEPSFILYTEYRLRDTEHQPLVSFSVLYTGFSFGVSCRYYSQARDYDYFFEVGYDTYSHTRLSVGYGVFSGDIVCSSGVCRYEPPFEGIRGSLQLSLPLF